MKASEVKKRLKNYPDWTVNAATTQIAKTYSFPSFVAGLAFVAKIAVHAEILGHHPDVELSYGKVKVRLSTHDAKGLTPLDFELAERIDSIAP